MKRKLLISLLIIIVLVGGAVVFVAVRANSILALLKPEIEQAASAAIGAKLTIDELQLSVLGQEVEAKGLTIGDQSTGQITLESALVKTNLKSLLDRRLEVEALKLKGANLTVIRSERGTSVLGLPTKTSKPSPPLSESGAVAAARSPTTTVETGPSNPLTLSLRKFALTDSIIIFKDTSLKREFTLGTLSIGGDVQFDGAIANVSHLEISGDLKSFGPILIKAEKVTHTLIEQRTEIDEATATLPAGTVRIKGAWARDQGTFEATTKSLNLEPLVAFGATFSPLLEQYKIKGQLDFTSNIKVGKAHTAPFLIEGPLMLSGVAATVNETMLVSSVSGEVQLRAEPDNYKVTSKSLALKVNGEPLQIGFESTFDTKKFVLPSFNVQGFTGTSNGTFGLTLNESLEFSSQFNGDSLSIDSIVRTFKPELKAMVSGTILHLSNEAFGELKKLPSTLRAHGTTIIKDGALKGMNLPGLVLKKVEGIPLLQGSLYMLVPPAYQPLFASPDTPIRSLEVTYGVSGSSLNLQSLNLESDIFSLKGKGSVKTAGAVDLDTTITFTPEFSAALCGSQPQLSKILAADGRLTFPLTIKGTPPAIIVIPNLKEVLKLAAGRVLKDKATDILDRALGGGGRGKLLGDVLGF